MKSPTNCKLKQWQCRACLDWHPLRASHPKSPVSSKFALKFFCGRNLKETDCLCKKCMESMEEIKMRRMKNMRHAKQLPYKQKSLTGPLQPQHPKSKQKSLKQRKWKSTATANAPRNTSINSQTSWNTVDTDIDDIDEQDSTRGQTNSGDNAETEAYKTPIRITNDKPSGAKTLKPRSLQFPTEEEAAHLPGGQEEAAHLPGGQEEDAHLRHLLQQLSSERNAVQPLLQGTDIENLTTFNWQDLSRHIQKKSPAIHAILSAIAGDDNQLAVVMAASILFYNNETSNPSRDEKSSIQHSLGIILEHDGASQKTKELLHKLRLCVHPSTTKDWIENNYLDIDEVLEKNLQKATIPFEIICDNLDSSKFSITKKQENWHWFIALYMEKRIVGGDNLDNTAPKRDIGSLHSTEFIPDQEDIESLQKNIDFHIARVLVANLEFLDEFARVLPNCISHEYIEQSKKPSRRIGMKVFDANQLKNNDMRKVMGELMKTTADAQARQERRLVLGGDVVTCREAKAAEYVQEEPGSKSPVYRPEGFHRLINLLEIIYKEFYSSILGKIQERVGRKYVRSDGVRQNYRANEQFLDDVLDAYILKVGKEHFGMEDGGEPTKNNPPLPSTDKQKRKWLYTQARTIQRMMVNFNFVSLRVRIERENFLRALRKADGTYVCPYCNHNPFKLFGSFKKHMDTHKGEEPLRALRKADGTYVCPYCNHNRFKLFGWFKKHMDTHKGEEPLRALRKADGMYLCPYCNHNPFKPFGSFKKHMDTHIGEEPLRAMRKADGTYLCTHCNIRCTCFTMFKKHMKSKHQVQPVVPNAVARIPHLKVFLTVCFIARDTSDAYRMCDGDRSFRNAKFEFLYAFRSRNHNYKHWLWNMLAYERAVLTERQALEYRWNIGVNVEGGTGNNIPNDEFCEQHVQRLQRSIEDQGADKSFQLLQQNCNVSQVVGHMHDNFQRQGLIENPETTEHSMRRDLNARNAVFEVEIENNRNILDPTDKIDAQAFWENVQKFKEELSRLTT